ncbi:hypothetical protein [Mariniflexile sp.]|uniref:hypothetical protein n=1 Tax=Mariniflexile sp. TaxID=1979402 RepID=UPI0040479738
MNNEQYIETIKKIIESKKFNKKLKKKFQNFPNQKLEFHIRNILTEFFNKNETNGLRAFAEHPRYTDKETKKRVSIDFSITKNRNVDFTMEIKYNFPNDSNQFSKYENVINKSFVERTYHLEKREIDSFLLIICDTNRQEQFEFENKWSLNLLSQYQVKKIPSNWEQNILNILGNIKNKVDCEFFRFSKKTIQTSELTADFHFYILYRKSN